MPQWHNPHVPQTRVLDHPKKNTWRVIGKLLARRYKWLQAQKWRVILGTFSATSTSLFHYRALGPPNLSLILGILKRLLILFSIGVMGVKLSGGKKVERTNHLSEKTTFQ